MLLVAVAIAIDLTICAKDCHVTRLAFAFRLIVLVSCLVDYNRIYECTMRELVDSSLMD